MSGSGFEWTLPNLVDYPLMVVHSYEDYSRIGLKQLYSFPEVIFYDNQYPQANLYPWPIPYASIYELHIVYKISLGNITDPTANMVIPPVYEEAMVYNLAARLMAAYGKAPRQDVGILAKTSLNVIKNSNAQIAMLQIPTTLLRAGIYNPYSDRSH
jgi:hypothetical protein